jgi:predicted TPR repeat methyltransferase
MSSTLKKDLWKPRTVAETKKIYADWADSYDTDVLEAGYATPGRVALVLRAELADLSAPILDFGCGTGLSGLALREAGCTAIDGTDISPEMIEHAKATGAYDKLWVGDQDALPGFAAGDYASITATGVVSLGAAPPELLATLLDFLAPGGLLALSYNDATLEDPSYMAAMEHAISGPARLLVEEYGPHLPAKNMNSMVYLLQKT